MPRSARYKTLERRFETLRRQFAPKTFSATGVYNKRALDFMRAFRLLIHAEFEQYFEDRVIDVADRAVQKWQNQKRTSKPLACLLANMTGELNCLPTKLGTGTTITTLAHKCLAQFRYTVTHNHGIKTENILSLMLPVGIEEAALDTVWLANLDSFGGLRGKAAHSSWITYTIDPKSDLDLASDILVGIDPVDTLLNELR